MGADRRLSMLNTNLVGCFRTEMCCREQACTKFERCTSTICTDPALTEQHPQGFPTTGNAEVRLLIAIGITPASADLGECGPCLRCSGYLICKRPLRGRASSARELCGGLLYSMNHLYARAARGSAWARCAAADLHDYARCCCCFTRGCLCVR